MIVIRLIVNVFFPLVIGVAIYLFLRCKSVFFIDIAENMFFMSLDKFRGYTCQKVVAADWITNNLPDGLWVYSLTSLMLIIWEDNLLDSYFWILSGLLVAFVSEFCQAVGILPGRYDPIDMAFYILAFVVACFNFSPIMFKNLERNRS